MRWSEIETVNFVKIYLSHEYLWNPYDPGYKCRNKRQNAYRNIISKFQSSTGILMDEVDLRIKIKNLRSTYAQEVSKIRQRSGPDFVYTPSIKWFTDWHRCFNNIKKGISSSSDVSFNYCFMKSFCSIRYIILSIFRNVYHNLINFSTST